MSTTPAPLSTTATTPQREMDEVSIASDFSVIPESLVEAEGPAAASVCPTRTVSTASFLHSEDLQPSLTALHTHTKVSFQGIQATYYCDSDIAVTYQLSPVVTPRSSDRIGLYRVGFSCPQDYIGYQWAPSPPPDQQPGVTLPLTVVFKAATLPKEVGEFYQFCYVTHDGQIAGVSGPFQLLRVGAARDVCEVEEDGMVVVRSGESVLHDRINELSVLKEQLVGECATAKRERGEVAKQLEEKVQQLNMCQHHLQALEVKMKRETAEKCELMGRIGQVVEEKGHLEDRLRTLERTVAAERTRADVGEAKVKELEEAALSSRKALESTTHSLRAAEDDLAQTKEALKATTVGLEEERVGREKAVRELSMWTTTAQADQSEKNSLAQKYNSVSEELTTKMEELETTRRNFFSMEEKLNETVKELEELKLKGDKAQETLEELEGEKKVLSERQEALGLDNSRLQAANTALKERLATLEEEQEREIKGREAAETIASDLSGRLQAAKTEYTALALTNKRLIRKLKKMRNRVSESTLGGPEGSKEGDEVARETAMSASTMTTSSWLQLEEEEEVEEGEKSVEEEAPPLLSQSCLSQHMGSSCCSHSTQQLSEAVNRKMEDIVKELSQQILSLKCQLEEKERRSGDKENVEDKEEDKEDVDKEEDQNEAQRTAETATETATETAPVLYSNSFLRTATTAPVFLPEGGTATSTTSTTSTAPNAPSTTATAPSTAPQTAETTTVPAPQRVGYQYQPGMIPTQTPTSVPHSTANGCFLPPPLLPETTPTARHAAVLRQFAQLPPTAPPHDSDDDDFHSTDSDSSPAVTFTPAAPVPAVASSLPPPVTSQPQPLPQNLTQPRSEGSHPPDSTSPSLLQCPLCSLAFPRGTGRLLEEHVNSHLEHVCPVCSEVFQRNCQDRFQAHVQEHFKEEEEEEERRQQEEARRDEEDPSGPWGRHLRNAHLLEID